MAGPIVIDDFKIIMLLIEINVQGHRKQEMSGKGKYRGMAMGGGWDMPRGYFESRTSNDAIGL